MTSPDQLFSARFPRASQYNPEWVLANMSGGANALWLTEWLAATLPLRPGMRVLDLGCGRASSSIFLRREFGVQVWATDLWISASENMQRIRDAGVEDGVFPIHADARSLPFAAEFFDVIVAIDSFFYFGTDDHYLTYLVRFMKPGGTLGIAGAAVMNETAETPPEHLRKWWTPDVWCLHSAAWWRRHWARTGLVEVELADTMEGGWQFWLDWIRTVAPENEAEISALEADRGQHLGYARVVAHRRQDAAIPDHIVSLPVEYTRKPLLRTPSTGRRLRNAPKG